MNCIINGFDFWNMDAQKYYSVPATWSANKKKENAMNKIFSGDWQGSLKHDGCFYMVGKNLNGDIFVRPRAKNTKGEFVNKVDWVPHLHKYLNDLEPGTVMLGELYLPKNEHAKSTSSIMNSLQSKAVKKQEKEDEKLILYIFDILALEGELFYNKPAEDRFEELNVMWRTYPSQYVEYAEYFEGKELWDMLQKILADGCEGMVITRKDAPYTPGSRKQIYTLKIKKELQDTIDCVVIGAESPTRLYNGKEIETWPYWFDESQNMYFTDKEYLEKWKTNIYTAYVDGAPVYPVTKNWFYGWAGSWRLGAYKDGKLVQIGKLSGLTDEMKENWKDYVGTVVEVSCMEIMDNEQGGKGLRHPKLINIRKDKDKTECLWEEIFK